MISVLMIMGSVAPLNNCAAIPNTKVIKYLSREDTKITLIQKTVSPADKTDEALVPEEFNHIKILSVPYSGFFQKTVDAQRNKMTQSGLKQKLKGATSPVKAWIAKNLSNAYLNTREIDWVNQAMKAVHRELAGEHFDVIYSSYPPSETHAVAKRLMEKKYADFWITDFRDPMFYEMFSYSHKTNRVSRGKKEQDGYAKCADLITIVSEGAREKFEYSGMAKHKLISIPNGYDSEDFPETLQQSDPTPGVFRLFYGGMLYEGKRNLSILFRALRELIDEGFIDQKKLSVEYAGNDWNTMQSFASTYQLESVCKSYGFIPHSQVLKILSEIDCSIVCSHNTTIDKGVVTGKVFDLLLAARPIICVVNGNLAGSELGQIIRDCRAGVVYEQANDEKDYPALKAWLKEAYSQKTKNGQVPSMLDVSVREQYSYQQIGRKLFQLMKQLKFSQSNSIR